MISTKLTGLGLALLVVFGTNANAKSCTCKDRNGNTIVTDSICSPDCVDQGKQLNDKGREIKKRQAEDDAGSMEGKSAEQKAAIERSRKDKALLGTYSNEKEIDRKFTRDLQQQELNLEGIRQQIQSKQGSLDGFRKEAIGKSGDALRDIQKDIVKKENELAELRHGLDMEDKKAATLRANYEADKLRYRELTGDAKK